MTGQGKLGKSLLLPTYITYVGLGSLENITLVCRLMCKAASECEALPDLQFNMQSYTCSIQE